MTSAAMADVAVMQPTPATKVAEMGPSASSEDEVEEGEIVEPEYRMRYLNGAAARAKYATQIQERLDLLGVAAMLKEAEKTRDLVAVARKAVDIASAKRAADLSAIGERLRALGYPVGLGGAAQLLFALDEQQWAPAAALLNQSCMHMVIAVVEALNQVTMVFP